MRFTPCPSFSRFILTNVDEDAKHDCPSQRLSTISEGVDKGLPITRIYGGDGSFVLLDEGCPASADDYDGELIVVCMSCLLEEHPEVGHALDLCSAYGAAHLEDGQWVAA